MSNAGGQLQYKQSPSGGWIRPACSWFCRLWFLNVCFDTELKAASWFPLFIGSSSAASFPLYPYPIPVSWNNSFLALMASWDVRYNGHDFCGPGSRLAEVSLATMWPQSGTPPLQWDLKLWEGRDDAFVPVTPVTQNSCSLCRGLRERGVVGCCITLVSHLKTALNQKPQTFSTVTIAITLYHCHPDYLNPSAWSCSLPSYISPCRFGPGSLVCWENSNFWFCRVSN